MNYSPTTLYLKELSNRLSQLEMPVYFKLPDHSVLEPFVVIGQNTSDTGKTAQTGALIEDVSVMIDIFLPGDSRTNAEETKSKALRLLGRNTMMNAPIRIDNSIGREVYHITLRVTETIM